MTFKNILILASCLLLTSCLSPVQTKPATSYMIACIPKNVPVAHKRAITLMVAQPDTVPVYGTTSMAYSRCPFQVGYFVRSRWAETPSQMFQPLIVQTLQNTHHFRAVVTPPFIGRYDYILSTTILKLQQDYACRPALLKLRVRAQITRASTNEVIATKEFCVKEPILGCNPYCGVIAANNAAEELLAELASFAIRRI